MGVTVFLFTQGKMGCPNPKRLKKFEQSFLWTIQLHCTHSHFTWLIDSSETIFTNPSALAGYDTKSILNRVWQVWIQRFHSPRLVASSRRKISLPFYLPIAGGKIIGFIPFLRVLVLCEMSSVSYRIWTRVAVTITITPRAPTYNNIIYN